MGENGSNIKPALRWIVLYQVKAGDTKFVFATDNKLYLWSDAVAAAKLFRSRHPEYRAFIAEVRGEIQEVPPVAPELIVSDFKGL